MRAQSLVESTVYFTGNILDHNQQPISGARVTINGLSRITDVDGYYSAALDASADGRYVLEIRKVGKAPLTVNYTDSSIDAVHILQPATTAVINASTGGRVTTPNGTYVDFPANSLVDANGNPATGSVTVTLAHYGPATMPGDMTAVDSTGQETYLVTVGALYVSAEGSNGVSYDLAAGASASAFVSVPSEYGGTMPSCQQGSCTVSAWQLGSDGRWYERGTVTTTSSGTQLTLRRPSATSLRNSAIPITRGLGFWNADISFSDPACTVVQFQGVDASCFGQLGATGYPGITLTLKLPTPFGSTYTKTQTVNDPNATFVVLYNLMASRLGSAPIHQEVELTFPADAPVSLCAQRLVIDSSPRAPTGFPTYVRPSSGGGGGGNTRFEPGLPWGGTGQPAVTSVRGGGLQHPCRSKVVFKAQ